MDSSISTIDINIEDLQSKPNELNASIISNDIVNMNDQLNDIINNQDTNSLLPAHETNCIINNEIDKQSSSNSKVYDMDQVHLYNFIVIHQFNQPYSYIYIKTNLKFLHLKYLLNQECRTLEIFINETMIKMHKMAQDRR